MTIEIFNGVIKQCILIIDNELGLLIFIMNDTEK